MSTTSISLTDNGSLIALGVCIEKGRPARLERFGNFNVALVSSLQRKLSSAARTQRRRLVEVDVDEQAEISGTKLFKWDRGVALCNLDKA